MIAGAHRRSERGAVAILIVFAFIILIGFMAFAIDPGVLFQERRDLQTGAEAAALAVAQDCATAGACPSQSAMDAQAQDYLSLNLTNGPGRIVGNVTVDTAASTVTVTVGGYDTANNRDGDPNTTDLYFGPAIGVDSFAIEATAVASYGGVGAAAATPLIFSKCEYDQFGASPIVLKFHNSGNATLCNGPAGQDLPGGFGWLVPDGECLAHTNADGWFSSNPGVSPPGTGQSRCKTTDQIGLTVNGQPNPELLIPIFDDKTGTGSGALFHLFGYAGFNVQGWFFTSQIKGDPAEVYKDHCGAKAEDGEPQPGNNYDDCVIGNFTKFYAPGEVAGGPNLGVSTVSLVG